MKKYSSVWIAVVGVAIGALLMLTITKYNESRRYINAKYRDWGKLNVVLQQIERNYVDTVDVEGVSEAAISAALAKLDPHSVYMPPVQLQESETELAGNFEGIGIQFNVPNDTAIVLEVIPGGPSEKVGLQAGDRLLKVGEKSIAGCKFPQDSMVRRMKGPAGTKVTITVARGKEIIPFEITRGKIPLTSIDAYFMIDAKTGYIRLSKFARTTFAEFIQAIADLSGQGMEELIFDLRDNTGGYFDQAEALADLFLPKGAQIVYLEGLHRSKEAYDATGRGPYQNLPLKVLINENSASSSEIFAGAIQDNDRGVIIGRRSFGKGLVQEPVFFTDGSGIRLTVARYHTPSGRCIQKPYSEDYAYDVYKRYTAGELMSADSIKVDTTLAYKTVGGRTVYGGGGIVPDVFVPMDTTKASAFFSACNKKATTMRFASYYFDHHKAELSAITDYNVLLRYLDAAHLDKQFLSYAKSVDNLAPKSSEDWQQTSRYMMPQIKALVGRYSKLGDKAFYHIYLDIDETVAEALKPHSLF